MTTRQDRYEYVQDEAGHRADVPAMSGERRRRYIKPAITHELELETRAGSPLGIPDPLDPFGLEPKE